MLYNPCTNAHVETNTNACNSQSHKLIHICYTQQGIFVYCKCCVIKVIIIYISGKEAGEEDEQESIYKREN